MADSIGSGSASILPCPQCGEMIYSDVTACRFCSAAIDPQAAAAGAKLQKRINDACNHAKIVRNMAGVMWILFLVRFVFFGLVWGFIGLFFFVPAYLIFWQVKYGSLKTQDPDFNRAKRDRLIALLIWLPALALQVLLLAVQLFS